MLEPANHLRQALSGFRPQPLECQLSFGIGAQTGGRHLFVYDFRMEEVSFALEQLWTERWADWGRMFLVGTSEGGVTAALYRGDEFKARVIAQWTCSGAPHVAGIAAPLDEPILAVRGAQDPWYGAKAGDCRGPKMSRTAIQACLQPDRRVEIEVGSREAITLKTVPAKPEAAAKPTAKAKAAPKAKAAAKPVQ